MRQLTQEQRLEGFATLAHSYRARLEAGETIADITRERKITRERVWGVLLTISDPAPVWVDWSNDKVLRLQRLWAMGHTIAVIGYLLGISKNAVVGKAHRLGLPPRPSPIKWAA